MNRLALATAALAAIGLTACQASTSNDGTVKIESNGQIVEEGARDLGNRAKELAKDGVNVARQGINELRPVGDEIANGAKAAYNEIRQEVRGIGNNKQ